MLFEKYCNKQNGSNLSVMEMQGFLTVMEILINMAIIVI